MTILNANFFTGNASFSTPLKRQKTIFNILSGMHHIIGIKYHIEKIPSGDP